MGLKPEISQYLTQRAALGLPAVWQAPLDEIRGNTQTHVALTQPLIELFEVTRQMIPVQNQSYQFEFIGQSTKLIFQP